MDMIGKIRRLHFRQHNALCRVRRSLPQGVCRAWGADGEKWRWGCPVAADLPPHSRSYGAKSRWRRAPQRHFAARDPQVRQIPRIQARPPKTNSKQKP